MKLLFTVFVSISSVCVATPIQWSVENGGNDHYYEVVSETSGIWWTQAKAASEDRGGYLATITSQAESDFVFSLVDVTQDFVSNCWGPWLGGFQPEGSLEPDGNWQWITGELWDYTNWDRGHPGDGGPVGSSENFLSYGCGYLGDLSKWNDLGNKGAYDGYPDSTIIPIISYVVEYEPVPEPTTLLLLGLGGLLIRRKR